MIDLNYKKKQPAKYEPEEIAIAVFTVCLWVAIAIAFLGAL